MHATPSYHRLIASFPQDVGMAPRAVRSLLQKLGGMANDRSLCMSLYDVTNDGVVDLLEPKPLLVEDSEGAVRAPLPMCVCEEERERECLPILLCHMHAARGTSVKDSVHFEQFFVVTHQSQSFLCE